MTPKQRRFAEEYLLDLNATQAALRAGYSRSCAGPHGSKLSRRPDVARFVAAAQAKRAARTELTADRVLEELAKVAFGDPRRLFAWGPKGVELRDSLELSEAEAALVSEITEQKTATGSTKRIKLHCKMSALMALARHMDLLSGRLKPPARADAGGDDNDDAEDVRALLARRIAGIAERLESGRDPGGDRHA